MATIALADAATEPKSKKSNTIKNGSDEQKELFALFEEKGWLLLPKRNVELNKLLEDKCWSRNQLSRQFALWSSSGTLGSVEIKISGHVLLESLEDRCGTAESILTETKKKLERPLTDLCFPESDKESLFDIRSWQLFRKEVLDLIVSCSASKLSEVSVKSELFYKRSETLVERYRVSFGGGDKINNFFVVFAMDYIVLLKASIAEPDVDGVEYDIFEDFIEGDFVDLKQAYAETLYYICGYLLKAAAKIGKGTNDRSKVLGVYNAYMLDNVLVGGSSNSAAASLPTRKTDRISKGNLLYPTVHFYQTFVLIERIYMALLTADNLIAFGPYAIKRIHEKLANDERIRNRLIHGTIAPADAANLKKWDGHLNKVVDYILRTYSRVRGKDFAFRLLKRSRKSLHSSTRSELKVLSNPKARAPTGAKKQTQSTEGEYEKEAGENEKEAGENNNEETSMEAWFDGKGATPEDHDIEPNVEDLSSESESDTSKGSEKNNATLLQICTAFNRC
jgi:hypothetical protein